MSLIRKLLAGLSSIALTAAPGAGLYQAVAADQVPPESSAIIPDTPLATMTLAELYSFVNANVSGTAASAEQAATQFARLLAGVTGGQDPSPQMLIAVANAFQLMLEELRTHHGPIDADGVLAAARTTYLAALPTAAGETPGTEDDGTVGPDFSQVAETPY